MTGGLPATCLPLPRRVAHPTGPLACALELAGVKASGRELRERFCTSRVSGPGSVRGLAVARSRSRELRMILREPPVHNVAEHLGLCDELADIGFSGNAYPVIVNGVAS